LGNSNATIASSSSRPFPFCGVIKSGLRNIAAGRSKVGEDSKQAGSDKTQFATLVKTRASAGPLENARQWFV